MTDKNKEKIKDAGSPITNVEDDKRRRGKIKDAGCPIEPGMTARSVEDDGRNQLSEEASLAYYCLLPKEVVMAAIKTEIAAYKKMQSELEAKHLGKWVVVHDEQLIGVYESLQNAGVDAITKFDRGPYLIHQVGKPFEIQLPAKFHVRI